MINHLPVLLKSCQRYPELLPFLSKLSSTHGLVLNHPIQFTKHPSLGFSLRSLSTLKPNSNILNININKCLTSHYFINSSLSQNNKFSATLNSFTSLDPSKDQDIIKICKIVLQLIVNLNSPSFQLHQYSHYLSTYNSPSFHNLTIQDIQAIKSQQLLSIILNSQYKLDKIAAEFHLKFPFVTPEQFLKMYVLTRSRAIKLNDEMVLAPVIDMINHSFENNCEVGGKFVMGNSFVTLNSVKKIEEGEELSINYGEISNNQLFFKYNFVVKENLWSCFMVRLNYEESQEFAEIQFERKKGLLEKLGGIPEVIKVYRKKIDGKSMAILRLYFMDQKDMKDIGRLDEDRLKSKVSDRNEARVLSFLITNLNTTYMFMKDIEHNVESIQYIQTEEVIIVKDFLKNAEKELKELKTKL